MSKKFYIITKDEYDGSRRVLGYFEKRNNDLYYDIGSINGSHNSYHRDGSEWRTTLDGKKKKITEHIPLGGFKGFHPLGIVMFTKELLSSFPKAKEKHINKKLLEIDFSRYPSDIINLVLEIIEPEKELAINEDTVSPLNAVTTIRKEIEPWLIFTILGHDDNLLIKPDGNGYIVNHFNKRFSANEKNKEYYGESIPIETYKKDIEN